MREHTTALEFSACMNPSGAFFRNAPRFAQKHDDLGIVQGAGRAVLPGSDKMTAIGDDAGHRIANGWVLVPAPIDAVNLGPTYYIPHF